MRLRMLVSRLRFCQFARERIDVIMALAGAIDAVGPMKPGVEPLRRVRRDHLLGEHEAQLVEERLRVFFRREILALPAPIGPAAGEAIEHLLGRELADETLGFREQGERLGVGHRAPQPGRHGLFLDLLQPRGDAGLAEILLREDVGGDLRPELGHFDIFQPEHDRTIGVADLGCRQPEINPCIG